MITGLTFLVYLSDELHDCLVSQLFCQSSTGAGDGGDNNPRVHSDGWQRGRGSGIVSTLASNMDMDAHDSLFNDELTRWSWSGPKLSSSPC